MLAADVTAAVAGNTLGMTSCHDELLCGGSAMAALAAELIEAAHGAMPTCIIMD
jgi:hypothetical protein